MLFLILVSCQQKTIMALVDISTLTAFVFPSASLRTAVYFLPCLCLNQRVTCSGLLNLHHAVVDSPSLVRAFLAEYFLAVPLNKRMQYRDGFFPLAPLQPSFFPLLLAQLGHHYPSALLSLKLSLQHPLLARMEYLTYLQFEPSCWFQTFPFFHLFS